LLRTQDDDEDDDGDGDDDALVVENTRTLVV
jgi:hypothetical protein